MEIGEQEVREEHGLGLLQVRVAGKRVGHVALCQLDERPLRIKHRFVNRLDLVAQKQPYGDRNLIVTAAARVQFVTDLPDEFDQTQLDETVDVLGHDVFKTVEKTELGDHLTYLLQSVDDGLNFGLLQDSGPPEPARMNRACPQVGEDQATVEAEAGVERREMFVGLAGEPASPEIHKIADCGLKNILSWRIAVSKGEL